MGVAIGLANAVGKMQGSQVTDFLEKVIIAVNNIASTVNCKSAGDVAGCESCLDETKLAKPRKVFPCHAHHVHP
jgi:hypothetical protein